MDNQNSSICLSSANPPGSGGGGNLDPADLVLEYYQIHSIAS